MAYVDLLSKLHKSTKRDYLARVLAGNKAEFATLAKKFDLEYWDAGRDTGYGGYHYDGRWRELADTLRERYQLKSGDRILDVGCGKGFLLYELTLAVPGVEVSGIDVSGYALDRAQPDVRPFLRLANATALPFPDDSFDLVLSLNTLHNLYIQDLYRGLQEIERVGKRNKYIVMDSYRNEQEKVNLLYWQLTCECFFTPAEWEFIFKQAGYTGDYGFVYFE
jgi:protein-L-isoaspartate(D-aspartate) O-methyltransferase